MTDYTVISNENVEPDAPFISATAFALRDNPVAIAEGAAGAPRIVYAALSLSNDLVNSDVANGTLGAEKFQTGTPERDWVLARTSAAATGAVGTYAMLRHDNATQYQPGDTLAGSELNYSNGGGTGTQSPAGTWRCMGFANSNNQTVTETSTLWLRIS